jgi:ABC-type nitrate/sulfonate/bicarbonate transport system substrate-binding protein
LIWIKLCGARRTLWSAAMRLLLCCLVVTACSRSEPTAEHVVIGVPLLRIAQPVFVAADHGLFERRGLHVELRRFDTAQPLADELAAGRLDAAGYMALPILFSREGGPPRVKVATAIVEDDAHPISFLLVKARSPLGSVEELAGKNVGILPTLAYRRWLEAVLANHGLSPGAVTVTPLAPQLQLQALEGGGVDALFTGDPMATAALARGIAQPLTAAAEVPKALGAPFFFGTFALNEAFVARRPAAAAAVVEALDEAIGLIDKDPDVGRTALSHALKEGDRAFLSQAPIAKYLSSTAVTAGALDAALQRESAKPEAAALLWRPP